MRRVLVTLSLLLVPRLSDAKKPSPVNALSEVPCLDDTMNWLVDNVGTLTGFDGVRYDFYAGAKTGPTKRTKKHPSGCVVTIGTTFNNDAPGVPATVSFDVLMLGEVDVLFPYTRKGTTIAQIRLKGEQGKEIVQRYSYTFDALIQDLNMRTTMLDGTAIASSSKKNADRVQSALTHAVKLCKEKAKGDIF